VTPFITAVVAVVAVIWRKPFDDLADGFRDRVVAAAVIFLFSFPSIPTRVLLAFKSGKGRACPIRGKEKRKITAAVVMLLGV